MTWFRPCRALAAVIAVLCVLLGVQTVRLSAAKEDVATEQKSHSETKRLHAEVMAEAISQARQTENDLRSGLERVQAEAAKERESAKAREDALVESVRSGERRLRIAAVCSGGSQTGNDTAVAGGGGAGVQVAELDGQASERILSVTIDGDRYIRERNACVAAYEALRKRINGDQQPAQ